MVDPTRRPLSAMRLAPSSAIHGETLVTGGQDMIVRVYVSLLVSSFACSGAHEPIRRPLGPSNPASCPAHPLPLYFQLIHQLTCHLPDQPPQLSRRLRQRIAWLHRLAQGQQARQPQVLRSSGLNHVTRLEGELRRARERLLCRRLARERRARQESPRRCRSLHSLIRPRADMSFYADLGYDVDSAAASHAADLSAGQQGRLAAGTRHRDRRHALLFQALFRFGPAGSGDGASDSNLGRATELRAQVPHRGRRGIRRRSVCSRRCCRGRYSLTNRIPPEIAWNDHGTIWAAYRSGLLVQHDVRLSSRPVDGLPSNPISWDPRDSIAVALEQWEVGDVPFDDL